MVPGIEWYLIGSVGILDFYLEIGVFLSILMQHFRYSGFGWTADELGAKKKAPRRVVRGASAIRNDNDVVSASYQTRLAAL